MSYTKGPWVYEWSGAGYTEGYVTVDENIIAIVCGSNYGQWRDTDDCGEAEFQANARLISAAPELLEFAEEWIANQGDDDNYMTAKARAAIAKAKGEQV